MDNITLTLDIVLANEHYLISFYFSSSSVSILIILELVKNWQEKVCINIEVTRFYFF